MDKKIIVLIMILLFIPSLVIGASYRTIYSPFTGKLDYVTTGNFTNDNISVDYLCLSGTCQNTWNRLVNYTSITNYPVACSPGFAKSFDNYTSGTATCVSIGGSGTNITNTHIVVSNVTTDCVIFAGGKICSGLD